MFSNDLRDSSRRRRAGATRRASGMAVVERLEARVVLALTPTATSLVVSATRVGFGQPVDLTATVSSTGPTINGGTVAFRAGSTVLGSALVVNGQATLSVPDLGVGSYLLTAAFSGTSNDLLPSVSGVDGTSPISTIAGNHAPGFAGDGGAAISAQLNYPSNLAVDAAGNVYIVDNGNNRIRKVATDGTISTVAGTGVGGFSGDGGQATAAQLQNPYSIAVDAAGNIFIGDDGNNRIRKVDAQGTISTYAGTGTSGFSGDGGPATLANLRVASMAVDSAGTVYFTDQGNGYVRKITTDGIITTIAGNGTSGYSGDGGQGTAAQLRSPYGVGVDAAGNVYFAEISNHVIRKVTPQGIISTYAGTGVAGSTGDGDQATLAWLSTPGGMAVDASGNVFFNQFGTNQVRKVAPDGIISTVAGTGTSGYSGDGGPSTSAQLNDTEGLAIDATGNLYLADSSNNVVRKVDGPAPLVVTAAPARLTLSASTGTSILGRLVTLTATVVAPGTSVTPNDGVVTFRDGTTVLGTAPVVNGVATLPTAALALGRRSLSASYTGSASFLGAAAAAFAPSSPISLVAGTGTGTGGFGGDNGPAVLARLAGPRETAFDAAGNLYIADEANFRIRKVTPDGTITTVAGTGTRAYGGDGGLATQASLGITLGLALDAAGNLYFTDTENHVIRRVGTDGIIATIAGDGTAGDTGDGGPAAAARISSPTDLVIDAAGNLYFGEGSSRIRKIATDGTITTVAGTGTPGNTGDGGAATSAQIGNPYSLAIDAAGNLYFGDIAHAVVRKVATSGIITTVAGDGVTDTTGGYGNGGLATQARLGPPHGVAVDAAGDLLIQDGASLRLVTPDGLIQRLDGVGAGSLTATGGPVSGATINDLVGLSTDAAGDLYLAVYNSGAIFKVARQDVVVDVNAAPVALRITTTGPVPAGMLRTFTITAVDANGQPVPGFDGTINLTSTDPRAALPGPVVMVNGVATFDAALFGLGAATITARDDASGLTGATAGLTVIPAAAATYGFVVTTDGQPTGGRLVTVTAYDLYGNIATGYAGTANVTATDPGYQVPATITFVAGRASFAGAVGIPSIPTITVTDATNPSLRGSLAGETTPAVATRLAVVVAPAVVAGGTTVITVTAVDDQGNLVTGYNGPITLTTSDGRAVLPGGIALVNGIATFDVSFRTAGTQALGVAADGDASLTGSASAIPVAPAVAARVDVAIAPASVAGQSSRATVTAFDAYGNVATNLDGPIALVSTDPQAVLPAGIVLAGGTASFDVSFRTAGPQTLTVLGGPGASLSGTSASVAVSPSDAARFSVLVTPGLPGGPVTVTVAAFDAFGNPATGYNGAVRLAASDPAATVPADAVLVNGAGTFAAVLGLGASQTITATDPANPSVVGTSAVVVLEGAARGVVFLDRNADGIRQADEVGLAGRLVYLDLNASGTLDAGEPTATTGADGSFLFPGVAQGTATIREAPDRNSSLRFVVNQGTSGADGSVAIGATPFSPLGPVSVLPSPFAGAADPDANAAFVRSLYRAVLARDGSDAEVGSWAVGLAAGKTRAEVAESFLNSPEHRRLQVGAFYRAFLHRDLDAFAQGWVDALMGGKTEAEVSAAILDSAEYRAAHADDASFVTGLYRDTLGRDADPASLAGAVAALGSGTARAAVIGGVVNSAEAVDQVVDGYYSSYLRRGRDPFSGYWTGILGERRGSASTVAAGILASPEFAEMARTQLS